MLALPGFQPERMLERLVLGSRSGQSSLWLSPCPSPPSIRLQKFFKFSLPSPPPFSSRLSDSAHNSSLTSTMNPHSRAQPHVQVTTDHCSVRLDRVEL